MLIAAASGPLPVASPRADGPASIVAGDVIVRFSDGSDPGARVSRAVRGEAVPGETEEVAARLSGDLGVPLRAARVTSGRELVLSVEREELARMLARRIARDPAVRGVARVEVPQTVLPAAGIALAVELRRGSEEDQQVAAAAKAGRRMTPEVAALVARLAAGARPPLAGRVTERGGLILTADLAALTRDLVGRLGQRADVEYAQPSHVARPLGGDAR
jgi:hypothetical protein